MESPLLAEKLLDPDPGAWVSGFCCCCCCFSCFSRFLKISLVEWELQNERPTLLSTLATLPPAGTGDSLPSQGCFQKSCSYSSRGER